MFKISKKSACFWKNHGIISVTNYGSCVIRVGFGKDYYRGDGEKGFTRLVKNFSNMIMLLSIYFTCFCCFCAFRISLQ